MPNYNNWTGVAHLGRDPELKNVGNHQLAESSIAVNFFKCDEKGGPIWVDIKVWGKQAEWLAKARKGDAVLISGELQMERWKNKNDGSDREKLTINVNDFRSMERREPKGDGSPAPSSDAVTYDTKKDDIPF